MTSFLSQAQIETMGFKFVGKNVHISSKASFYGAHKISIGDNSRIDDFCVLSASHSEIIIGQYVHIAVFCCLTGRALIRLDDFSGLSSRVSIYSTNDDYSGAVLTNPCIPSQFGGVSSKPVILEKHVVVGTNTTILPGVTIGQGAAIGAYSLITRNIDENTIAVGVPAKPIKKRKLNIYDLEKQLRQQYG